MEYVVSEFQGSAGKSLVKGPRALPKPQCTSRPELHLTFRKMGRSNDRLLMSFLVKLVFGEVLPTALKYTVMYTMSPVVGTVAQGRTFRGFQGLPGQWRLSNSWSTDSLKTCQHAGSGAPSSTPRARLHRSGGDSGRLHRQQVSWYFCCPKDLVMECSRG